MQLSNLLNAVGNVPKGRKRGFITAEIVTVPSGSEDNYTVKLSSSDTLSVKLPQGQFNIGDKVEIPVHQLMHSGSSAEVVTDQITISQNTIDKISQLLLGGGDVELNDTEKNIVHSALKILSSFSGDVQDQIFDDISRNVAGDKKNVGVIAQFVEAVLERIPAVMKSVEPLQRSEIFNQLSNVVTSLLTFDESVEGAALLPELADDLINYPDFTRSPLEKQAFENVKTVVNEIRENTPVSLFRYVLKGHSDAEGRETNPQDSIDKLIQTQGAKNEVLDRQNVNLPKNESLKNKGFEEQVSDNQSRSHSLKKRVTLAAKVLPVKHDESESIKKVVEQRLSLKTSSPKVLARLQENLNQKLPQDIPEKEGQGSSFQKSSAAEVFKFMNTHTRSEEIQKLSPPSNKKTLHESVVEHNSPDFNEKSIRIEGELSTESLKSTVPIGNESEKTTQDDSVDTSLKPVVLPEIESNDDSVDNKDLTMSLGDEYKAAEIKAEAPAVYERLVLRDDYSRELQKFIADRFPQMNSLIPEIDFDLLSRRDITVDQLQLLEDKIELLSSSESRSAGENVFLNTVVSKVFSVLSEDLGDSMYRKLIAQIEPVSKTVSEILSIVDTVEALTSEDDSLADLMDSVERIKMGISSVQSTFDSGTENIEKSPLASTGIKKVGGLWGFFFENTLKNWSEGENVPKESNIKQELIHLNNEITKRLISQTAKEVESQSDEKLILKNLNSKVTEAIQRIEGGQILAQPKETNVNTREQVMWIPVQMGGEWTRLGIEFRREGNSKNRGGKLGNRVNIQMDLKKMGLVTAELDLDAGKQLRVSLGASRPAAVAWFKEHEQDIYASLDSELLKSVMLSIRGIVENGDSQRPMDSFQVTG